MNIACLRPRPRWQALALATVAVVCAKLPLLAAASALDYTVLGLATLAAVVEAASWKAVLHRKGAIYEIYNPDVDVDGPTQAYRPVAYTSDVHKQCERRHPRAA